MGICQCCQYKDSVPRLRQKPLLSASKKGLRLNPRSWIGDSLQILSTKTLKSLTLPGTHDSGSYFLTDVPMEGDQSEFVETLYKLIPSFIKNRKNIFKNWAIAQHQPIYEQLSSGARYLDIRAGWDNENKQWVTYHFLIGKPISDLLSDISNFLNENLSEILIIEISHYRGSPSKENILELKNLVFQYLEKFLLEKNISLNFTVGYMVGTGKRAIVSMVEIEDDLRIWPELLIKNSYANTGKLQEMMDINEKKIGKSGKLEMIFKMSWTLTPGSDNIVKGIFKKPKNLIELAKIANKSLGEFYHNKVKGKGRMGNILVFDYFNSDQIMEIIWEMNDL